MSKANDTKFKIILVAFTLCFFCSVFVSTTAVLLKDRQDKNKKINKQKNILIAANKIKPGQQVTDNEVEEIYSTIRAYLIDFNTGKRATTELNTTTFNEKKFAENPATSIKLGKHDIAKIQRRANYGFVYEVIGETEEIESIIIPIRGYGLWSTLYGFLALDSQVKYVKGITFYQHAETPGLGGEVDNPNWQASWVNKKVYTENGKVGLKVVKGKGKDEYSIDGLSGATITSIGVKNMTAFWLGNLGYGKFLKQRGKIKND